MKIDRFYIEFDIVDSIKSFESESMIIGQSNLDFRFDSTTSIRLGLPNPISLEIGDNLQTFYIAQLVYLNCQDLCYDSLYWMTSNWLDQKFEKWMGSSKCKKNVSVPILCNTYAQLN